MTYQNQEIDAELFVLVVGHHFVNNNLSVLLIHLMKRMIIPEIMDMKMSLHGYNQ